MGAPAVWAERTAWLEQVIARLRQADPRIRAIVLFGSAGWMPDLARDLDILVITESEPQEGNDGQDLFRDLPCSVDLVIRRVGDPLGSLAAAVRAGRLLWGDPQVVREALSGMPVPSPEEIWQTIHAAEDYARLAQAASNPWRQDRHYRTAFNTLFEAARLAVMHYLGTEERWGQLQKALPSAFASSFQRLVHHLHIRFWYEGDYPRDRPLESFEQWKEDVRRFVQALMAGGEGEGEGPSKSPSGLP